MYEAQTYEAILDRMLARVPNTIDKREGSIIYDACAPAAAELAQMYIELDSNHRLSFADTASGDYLTRKTAEFGVNRRLATAAVRLGVFYSGENTLMDVPAGSRMSIGSLSYVVGQRIGAGNYRLTCETAGVSGNEQFGALLPVDYIAGLARAELADVLVPGEEEEPDDALRERFYSVVNEPAYGGNAADYKIKINAIPGVGAVKIYPAWQGGGTVKCSILSSDWSAPSAAFVDEVQTLMDPVANSGKGAGLAPIGHQVTIAGVTERSVSIVSNLTLASGVTRGQVQADVEAVLSAYLLDLRKEWAKQQQLVVRTAQIDARLLTVQGIEDVSGTMINRADANLILESDEIPQLGTVAVYG